MSHTDLREPTAAPQARSATDPDEYVINPCLEVITRIEVRTRNGLGLADLDIDDANHRTIARVARSPGASLESLGVDEETRAVLIEAGLALRRSELPTTPTLEVALERLVEKWRLGCEDDGESNEARDELVPNKEVWRADIEPNVDRRIRRVYSQLEPLLGGGAGKRYELYVKDRQTGFVSLYRLEPRLAELWDGLLAAERAPRDLLPEDRRAFQAAQLLIPHAGTAAHSDRLVAEAADELRARGFVILRNLVNPVFMCALTEYAMALEQSGHMIRGDAAVQSRWVRHNDPVMRAVHWLIEPHIAAITAYAARPSRASYSYLSVYERGSILNRHVDRAECRWNVSLCLGTRPRLERAQQWPISLWVGDSAHELRLGPSDALLYSGTGTPHWRDELVQCDRYAACFFHFVDIDFLGPTE